jgi:hypothetical protein
MAFGNDDRLTALGAIDVCYIDFAVVSDTLRHIQCDCGFGTTGACVVSGYLNIYLCGKYSILKRYLGHVIVLLTSVSVSVSVSDA